MKTESLTYLTFLAEMLGSRRYSAIYSSRAAINHIGAKLSFFPFPVILVRSDGH